MTALVCAAQCVAEESKNVGTLIDSEEHEESRINELSVALSIEAQIDDLHSMELSRITRLLKHPTLDVQQAEVECKKLLTHRYTEEAEVLLAAIYIEKGDTAAALQCLTNVIEPDNSHWIALGARLNLLNALGEHEAASRDASTMMDMAPDDSFIGWANPSFYEFSEMLAAYGIAPLENPRILQGLVGLFAISCFLMCLRWGLRQKREANGTWPQLLGVAAFVTVLWTIPVTAAALMTGTETGYPPNLLWWAFIGLFAFFFIRGTMKPPNLTYVGKEALPECDSPEMLARIDRLSKCIGVATPTVRTQRAINDARDSAAAFVGGLAPHSIVLYDTILSQLREDEQDAIIGHELGHVANRSIWVYSAVFPLTMTAMIVLAFLGGGFFGVLAGSAIRAGLFRLMSRRFEYDCDRRAALATSPDAVARGLRRIYAGHVLGKAGLLTDIVHSTASHPSLNERVHAMDMLTSSSQSATESSLSVSYDNSRVTLCRKLVVVFAILWFCLTAYGITTTLMIGDSLWPMLALFATVFGPTFFIMLASRRALKIAKARMKGRLRWRNLTLRRKLGTISLVSCCVFIIFAWQFGDGANSADTNEEAIEQVDPASQAIAAAVIVMFGTAIFGFVDKPTNKHASKKAKLGQQITAAIQRNDFDEVIEICKENYDVVKHDKQLKYSGAAALLATQQLEKFIPYCEQIREEFPHFPPPAISLATAYLDRDEPEKALERIRDIEKDLHKADPLPSVMSSRALLTLGRLDEAKEACDRGIELAPDDVSSMAQAARVAMAAEELNEADRLIQQGSDLLPAEPLLIVARGERAVFNKDQTALQIERDALAAALEGDRLLCLYSSLAQFDQELASSSIDEL